MTPEIARERVSLGATLLDHAKPGWYRRINTETLVLHDRCCCVLGQVCGGRFNLDAVGLATFEDGERHGFSLAADFESDWLPLQEAWLTTIAERLESDAPVVRWQSREYAVTE